MLRNVPFRYMSWLNHILVWFVGFGCGFVQIRKEKKKKKKKRKKEKYTKRNCVRIFCWWLVNDERSDGTNDTHGQG